MQQFQLRRGVSYCHFDECTIVLDVGADRYWRLDRRSGESLAAVDAGTLAPCDEFRLMRLTALELVEPARGDSGNMRPAALAAVTASATEAPAAPVGFSASDVTSIVWQMFAARRALQRRPLDHLLHAVAQRRARADRTASGEVQALAISFNRYRRLLPQPRLCLPDSLAFLGFAARHGHYPYLVFGVEADPFSAHCWVQHEGTVLNDALDHAAVFKPILVV